MRLRDLVVTASVACAIGWFARSAWSDDPPADSDAAWAKLAQPGEQHARLKALAGEWTAHATFVNEGKTIESDSTATFSMILGDRYLYQEAKGTFLGMPFEGHGIIGYDNGKKRFVSTWIDNFGTGIVVGEGDETQPGKVWTFKSIMSGPTGPVATRDVITVLNEKEMTWESWMGDADKPMMTLRYKRKS